MFMMCISQCGKGNRLCLFFFFFKKGFIDPAVEFGDFLMLEFYTVCISSPFPFECFAVWVVCERPALAFCEGLECCLIILSLDHCSRLHLFSKWQMDLECQGYLGTHRFLNSIISVWLMHTLAPVQTESTERSSGLQGEVDKRSFREASYVAFEDHRGQGFLNFLCLLTPFQSNCSESRSYIIPMKKWKDSNKHLCAYLDSIMLSL